MSGLFYLGTAVTIGLIVAASYLSGRKVKSEEDFNRGRAGLGMTMGSLLGTIIGGSATVGTSQLAFTYGFSAWWFTLGYGLSFLVMALLISDRLRTKGILTFSALIRNEYGQRAGNVNAILSPFGLAVNIITQVLSGVSLITLLFPQVSFTAQAAFIALLMLLYTVFGGMKSIGAAGIVKTLLICPAMFLCAFLALKDVGGVGTFWTAFPRTQYFSLFARGLKTDLGAAVSTLLGVLTSQTYMQVIMAAGTERISKAGLSLSALIGILFGVAGVMVGLYMRYITPAEVLAVPELVQTAAATALPTFIQTHFSPFVAGLILSTLLISVVGTGASLALSVCTVIKKDMVDRLSPKFREGKKALSFSRFLLFLLLLVTTVCVRFFDSYIMDVSFLSLGLRANSTFAPLLFALFFPKKVPGKYAVTAMITGVGLMLLLKIVGSPVDPSLAGVGLSILIMLIGMLSGRKNEPRK